MCRPGNLLAVSLGVIGNVNTIPVSKDCNDFVTGITIISYMDKADALNNPFPNEVASVITIETYKGGSDQRTLQLGFRDNILKYRCRWVDTWGSWTQV